LNLLRQSSVVEGMVDSLPRRLGEVFGMGQSLCYGPLMCILMSTRKCTNRLQYSVCKYEVESTGKWSNIGVLFNQLHFNLVPKV